MRIKIAIEETTRRMTDREEMRRTARKQGRGLY